MSRVNPLEKVVMDPPLTFPEKALLIIIYDHPDIDIAGLIGDDPEGLTAIMGLAEKGLLERKFATPAAR